MLMDEPFGAVDLITRARSSTSSADPERAAQDDHLRHARHRRGDHARRPHRDLPRRRCRPVYTPEASTHPADSFVERFIGSDRGIKLLALRKLDELELAPLDGAPPDRLPQAPGSTTPRRGLADDHTGSRELVVLDGDDAARGVVTLDMLAELDQEGPGERHSAQLVPRAVRGAGDPRLRRGQRLRRREPVLLHGLGARELERRDPARAPRAREADADRGGHRLRDRLRRCDRHAPLPAHGEAVRRLLGDRVHGPQPRALPAPRPRDRPHRGNGRDRLVGYTL